MTQQPDHPLLLVHAYCDGELDPANALAFERRMAEDPLLAAERDRIMALKGAFAKLRPAGIAPPALRARVERTVGLGRAARRPTWSALAASILLSAVIASAATWRLLVPGGLVPDEVVDSHIRSLMAAQPFDVASSDRHTVKPWFNGHTIQSPRVVDLASDGFPLIGGRVDVIAKNPVPSLVYRYQKHLISVTQFQGPAPASGVHTTEGYHVIGWTDGGVAYWAVSDVGEGELKKFVQLFRAAPTDQ